MQTSVLRLLTCGSVDDGKSTLIGRLLVETDSVPHDTVDSTRKIRRSGSTIPAGEIDFSLLTDGLEAEREQGITIDVAYRSMNLPSGKRLIISDAPGHEQYTRNMAVAASRADIGLVLVDATKGVREQTRRHLTICRIMGVKHMIIAINKLDAMGYQESVFQEIESELLKVLEKLECKDFSVIPMSALAGDNVVFATDAMPWYQGQTLLEEIQNWKAPELALPSPRLRIQLVSRAVDFRGLSGTIHGGVISVGDRIRTFPTNKEAVVKSIISDFSEVQSAGDNTAVTLVCEPEVDATRGDLISMADQPIEASDKFQAHMVWLHEDPLVTSRSYLLISGPTHVPATISVVKDRFEINSGDIHPATSLAMNEIGTIEIATDRPMPLLPYAQSHEFGNFVLVDRLSFQTVAAGMIRHSLRRGTNIFHQDYEINKEVRSARNQQKARVIWLTGLSGSGKSTIANALEKSLFARGFHTYILDGDNVRMGLNMDLGFTPQARAENVRRVSEVSKLMVDAGLIVISALVSPFEVDRMQARARFEDGEFVEVHVDTPIEVCQSRDPKGLYKKAGDGQIPNFTGVGQDYERPSNPELVLDGMQDVAVNVELIIKYLESHQ
jgi:bifunctional enzyme CysN/CysC